MSAHFFDPALPPARMANFLEPGRMPELVRAWRPGGEVRGVPLDRGVPLSVAWHDRAACGNSPDDPVLFPGTRSGKQDQAAMAAAGEAYCDLCPVRAECLRYALAAGVSDGVWGGVLFRNGLPRDAGQRRPRPRVLNERCGHGHRRTAENTYTAPDGRTSCRDCRREQDARPAAAAA